MLAAFGGETRHASAALGLGTSLVGLCADERVARVRDGGSPPSGVADRALDRLLERAGRTRADIDRYLLVDNGADAPGHPAYERVPHHFAHACTAFLTSPFDTAAIVICDREAPGVTVWQGSGATVTAVDWPWEGGGFADAYSRCSAALGLQGAAADQRFEALARLRPSSRDSRVDGLMAFDGNRIRLSDSFDADLAALFGGNRPGTPASAAIAASVQARLGDLVLEFLALVRQRLGHARLCLGGSLFYHSSMNTRIRRAGLFDAVFVPVDPGNTGVAAGAALQALGAGPSAVSPFLGPAYTPDEMKQVLDNCKLQYSWESDGAAISAAVDMLREGRLVGWFDGAMEWGPRALGARCILANPRSPYVLDNLNRFLKQRESWRGYALSGLSAAVQEHFDGPAAAPFMECDFSPRDPQSFRHVLPSPEATVRVQTVDDSAHPRFAQLLRAFGDATGMPILVNTSFNGFHEPIVCSPRDAVRVFYGTGVDLLVMHRFVLRK